MTILILIKGRYKGRKDVELLFKRYTKRLRQKMMILSRRYKFPMPNQITLRPLYVKGGFPYSYDGFAAWCPLEGYTIKMNVETCQLKKDKGISILDHECAHIARCICDNDFTHGKDFKEMYAACKSV